MGSEVIRGAFSRVHERPVLVLGNQKSGTSAIAALFARRVGLSATLDILSEVYWPLYPRVVTGQWTMDQYVLRYRAAFSRGLVKDPNLTLVADALLSRFPDSPVIFVVRDPRDNLRSLLNRLDLPGDEPIPVASLTGLTPAWRRIVDGRWLGLDGDDHLSLLAERWRLCARVYGKHAERMRLVRYEDFVADKLGTLDALANDLGFSPTVDVRGQLDDAFQPRGNREVTPAEFFGPELSRLEDRTREDMANFGYTPSDA